MQRILIRVQMILHFKVCNERFTSHFVVYAFSFNECLLRKYLIFNNTLILIEPRSRGCSLKFKKSTKYSNFFSHNGLQDQLNSTI